MKTRHKIDLQTNLLYRLYCQLSILFLLVIIIFIGTLSYFLIYYLDFVLIVFDYFEKIGIISQLLKNIIGSYELKGLSVVFIWLFSYFYFFEHLRKKGAIIFAEESANSKYFNILLSLYAAFNYLPIYLLMAYLLFWKHAFFESIVVIFSLVTTRLIFVNVMNIFSKIVHNYKSLSDLNPLLVGSDLKTMDENLRKNIGDRELKSKDGTFLQSVLNSINVQAFVIAMLIFIFKKITLILRAIFALTFLTAFFGIIYEFNLLSILYIELTLIIWFFITSCIQYIPKKTVNIKMNNGEQFKDVFLIEDSSNGQIIVLNQENNTIRIMKNSIATINN